MFLRSWRRTESKPKRELGRVIGSVSHGCSGSIFQSGDVKASVVSSPSTLSIDLSFVLAASWSVGRDLSAHVIGWTQILFPISPWWPRWWNRFESIPTRTDSELLHHCPRRSWKIHTCRSAFGAYRHHQEGTRPASVPWQASGLETNTKSISWLIL